MRMAWYTITRMMNEIEMNQLIEICLFRENLIYVKFAGPSLVSIKRPGKEGQPGWTEQCSKCAI